MSESNIHRQLVQVIIDYICEQFPETSCFIETDLSDGRPISPLTNEGFRPDVYYEYDGTLIVGEAKTSGDILTKHSLEQYASYLRKCSLYKGKASFVAAVPWKELAEARRIIKQIAENYPGQYSIVVLYGIV